jgi:hypothetical protein
MSDKPSNPAAIAALLSALQPEEAARLLGVDYAVEDQDPRLPPPAIRELQFIASQRERIPDLLTRKRHPRQGPEPKLKFSKGSFKPAGTK